MSRKVREERSLHMRILSKNAFGAMLCASIVATAGADIIFDNIGSMNGTDTNNGSWHASQIFESSFAQYDIAAIEDFSFAGGNVDSVSFVLGGWNGYEIAGVSGYTFNVYSSIDAAGANLTGDILSMSFGWQNVDMSWGGAGEYLSLDLGGAALAAGNYFMSITPRNEFETNGQTGIETTMIGGDNGYQANPGGGFGFGAYQQSGANYAYLLEGTIPAPAAISLLGLAGLTVRRRR